MNRLVNILSILLSIFCIVSCDTAETVQPSENFYKLYGGLGNHTGVDMEVFDNNYFILGNAVNQAGRSRIFVVRADENGDEIWKMQFGGNNGSVAKSMDMDNDGNLIISSTINSPSGNKDVMFLWVDQNGQKIDSAVYGSPVYDEEAGEVLAASDGSFLMIGTTWELNPEDEAGRVNKIQILRTEPNSLDTLSLQQWERFKAQGTRDFGVSIRERGGTFYCLGHSDSEDVTGSGELDGFNLIFFQIDQFGREISARVFGTPADETATSILEIDQGFVLTGNTFQNGKNSIFVTRVTNRLGLQNSFYVNSTKNIEGASLVDLGLSYLVLGTELISNSDNNIYLANIDKTGGIIWENFFGSSQTMDTGGNSLRLLPGNSFVFVGTIDLDNQQKMCVLKVDKNGEL